MNERRKVTTLAAFLPTKQILVPQLTKHIQLCHSARIFCKCRRGLLSASCSMLGVCKDHQVLDALGVRGRGELRCNYGASCKINVIVNSHSGFGVTGQ